MAGSRLIKTNTVRVLEDHARWWARYYFFTA
jgi:hypothetical protein